jgi:hypothetical protein
VQFFGDFFHLFLVVGFGGADNDCEEVWQLAWEKTKWGVRLTGREENLLALEIGIQTSNSGVGLKLLPQAGNDNESCDHSDGNQTKPHEPVQDNGCLCLFFFWKIPKLTLLFKERPARFGNVANSVQRRVVEKLLHLEQQAGPEQLDW